MLECDSLLGIWLAVVFCSECVPDVLAILVYSEAWYGLCFYYDALKGCGALVVD